MPNVNLVGPVQGQPLDLQTQQALLQQQDALLQAMMAKGLEGESPVVHTGGTNPFARDVANWSGPLGNALKMGAGAIGQQNIADKRAELAADLQGRTNSEIDKLVQAMMPHEGDLPTETDLTGQEVSGGKGLVYDDPTETLLRATGSQIPSVQAMAKDMYNRHEDAMVKNLVTGDAQANMAARGNILPGSIPRALMQTRYGPTLNAGSLRMAPKISHVENVPFGVYPDQPGKVDSYPPVDVPTEQVGTLKGFQGGDSAGFPPVVSPDAPAQYPRFVSPEVQAQRNAASRRIKQMELAENTRRADAGDIVAAGNAAAVGAELRRDARRAPVQVAENTTATMRDVPADTSSYFNNPGITPSSQAGLGEAPIVRSNLGKLRVMEGYESTAQAKVQAEEAKSTRETLQEGYDKAQKFREAAPAVVQMMDLVHKSDLGGPLAAPLTVVRQIASQLGFSNDEMGRITNTQSFLKMALPHVIEKVREVSSRPSQLEFTNIQKLLAGNQDIDQGTAINVLRQILTEGMGNVETLQKNIDRASQLGFYGRGLAESREPGFSPKEILDQAYAIPGLHPDVVKGRAGFERLPTGTWLDTNLGQPQSYGANVREPGKAQPPATNTKGWVLMRDKNGNTAYVSPDGKQHEAVQ